MARVVANMMDLQKNQIGDGLFNLGSGQSARVIDRVELIQEKCAEILGFTPQLIRPEPAKNEQSLDLDYRIDKLLNTGFTLNGNPAEEIDAILRMCKASFMVAN